MAAADIYVYTGPSAIHTGYGVITAYGTDHPRSRPFRPSRAWLERHAYLVEEGSVMTLADYEAAKVVAKAKPKPKPKAKAKAKPKVQKAK